jgi:hypothetical protein
MEKAENKDYDNRALWGGKARIDFGPVSFVIQHAHYFGGMQDHPDQGVSIHVLGQSQFKETELLRFMCMDEERSYTYAPSGRNQKFGMDPTLDDHPVRWTVKALESRLPAMLRRAEYDSVAEQVESYLENDGALADLRQKLEDVAAIGKDIILNGRVTAKHYAGDYVFEAGNIRFGLEIHNLPVGTDGGVTLHVMTDLGPRAQEYSEEVEILVFDFFRNKPHYHYGPRNKNHIIYWDPAIVPDCFEWTMEKLRGGKLPAMIERAGYPGVVNDLDPDLIAAVLPQVEAKARNLLKKFAKNEEQKQRAKIVSS